MELVTFPKKEEQTISNYASEITHITLHGNFDDESCIEGVDICSLNNISDMSFDVVIASYAPESIPDLRKVFDEQRKIQRKGGRFMYWIMPFRLTGIDAGCLVKHRNSLAYESYAPRTSSVTSIPDCEFSIDWICEQASLARLEIFQILMSDDFSGLNDRWFVTERFE